MMAHRRGQRLSESAEIIMQPMSGRFGSRPGWCRMRLTGSVLRGNQQFGGRMFRFTSPGELSGFVASLRQGQTVTRDD